MTDTTTAGAGVAPAIVDVPVAIETVNEGQQAETKVDSQPDPAAELKKIQNALARKERRIGQVTAQKHHEARRVAELEAKLSKYEQSQQAQPQSGEPREDDPKYAGNYVEYLKDLAKYTGKSAATEELTAGQKKSEEAKTAQQQQAWKSQRDAHLDSNADVAESAFSDFTNAIEEASDIISGLSPHVHRAFLEADNGAFALYDLASNPEALEKLNNMTEYQVAMAVARAEDRALAKSKQKPVTNAPTPLNAAKGTSTGSKSPENMSGAEIRKWMKS